MNDEMLKLSNQLCFPLYVCSRQIIKLYTPVLNSYELTYTQYITLLALWEKDGQTVSELCQTLYLDTGTLTPLLKKLEKQGIIIRERSKEDERSVYIRLTSKGHALKEEAKKIPVEIARCVNLPMEDAMTLHRILHQLLTGGLCNG